MNKLLLRCVKEEVAKFVIGKATVPEIMAVTKILHYGDLLNCHMTKIQCEIAGWKKIGYVPEIADIEKWFRKS